MKKTAFMRVLAILLCAVMLFLAGCAATSSSTSDATGADGEVKYKETVNLFGVGSSLVSFDFDGSAKSLLMSHDRLVEKNYPEGKMLDIIPGLATEWEWIDDTTLEMKLREGVTFHNGEAFDADDVLFTFNECLLTHSMASKIAMLDHVEAIDDFTVRFFLKQYHSDFLFLLSEVMCSIVNREAVEENEIEGAYIGTGPYIITGFVQSDTEDMERNDNYWGEKGITKYFHFRTFPETATGLMALQNGETEAATFDVIDMPYIEEDPEIEARIVPNLILHVAFNTTKGPGSDQNLRLAIAYAMNPDDYVNSVDAGYSEPLNSFWGPHSYGFDDSIQPYGRDLEKAREYLEKSKYKEITVTVSNGISYIAEILQANCKEIGLTINIETMDGAGITAMSKFNVAEHEALLRTFTMKLNGDDCRRVFYPNSNTNKAILTDERVINLIDSAATEKDDAKRQEMYHEIQQLNHEECWYLPLCLACETTAYATRLQGVQFDPAGSSHRWTYSYVIEE